MVFVVRLSFRARQRFSTQAVDCLDGQEVLRANLCNRAVNDGLAPCPLANFTRNLRGELRLGWLSHQSQRFLDALLRDKAKEGGLFELYG